MLKLFKRLQYILFHSEGALLEFFMAFLSLVWGLWLISPYWDTFSATSAFTIMAQLAPEWLWGSTMTAVGIFKMYTILAENHRAKHYAFLAALFVWACVAISFIDASPYAVGSPVYSLIVITNAFIIWRNDGKQ